MELPYKPGQFPMKGITHFGNLAKASPKLPSILKSLLERMKLFKILRKSIEIKGFQGKQEQMNVFHLAWKSNKPSCKVS